MICRYSNVFVIDGDVEAAAGKVVRLSGIHQSFHLVNVLIDGDAPAVEVYNGSALAARCTSGHPGSMKNSNCTFSTQAVLTVSVLEGTLTRFQLLCRALDSKARPIDIDVV